MLDGSFGRLKIAVALFYVNCALINTVIRVLRVALRRSRSMYLCVGVHSRITATLSCQMTLQRLPFDRQICPIMFESCEYITDIFAQLRHHHHHHHRRRQHYLSVYSTQVDLF